MSADPTETKPLDPTFLMLLHRYDPEKLQSVRALVNECRRRGRSTDELFQRSPYLSGMYKVATEREDEVTREELEAICNGTGLPIDLCFRSGSDTDKP